MSEKKPTQQQPTEEEVQDAVAFALVASNLAGCTPPTQEDIQRLESYARGEVSIEEAIADARRRIQGV